MIIIYAAKFSPRLSYITSLLFTDILAVPITLTTNLSEYEQTNLPKLNYSKTKPLTGLFMECADLLYETEIKQQTINVKSVNENISFFPVSTLSNFEFDLFAACFYLVTRYEEYINFTPDKHGRFDATKSMAFTNNFLQKPLVNKWAIVLKQKLSASYPSLFFPVKKVQLP